MRHRADMRSTLYDLYDLFLLLVELDALKNHAGLEYWYDTMYFEMVEQE